ncbi:MAG: radical SAM protein, partial [Desulfovibrio sp.]
MFPARFLWKPVIQKLVTGRWRRPRMRRNMPSPPGKLVRPGLYLHVPFCKNLCPFCPYNRVEYQDDLFAAYERAMHQEIELYRPALDGQKFTTLYIGGGTPTVNLEGLLGILQHMVEAFGPVRDICIELHPANMETECLQALKNAGVTMLSIGVEAATDHVLAAIGRNHDGKTALDAASRAVEVGFNAVNADLMFALPEQSLEDWARDLDAVLATGVDQISTYPMFTFPYSDLGQSERIRKVTRPKSATIRAMLDLTDTKAKQAGFERCAVWSWLRPSKNK